MIDVGYGYEDIHPIIQSITDKEVIVAVTHGDADHALGVMHFDKFMIHPLDYGKLLCNDCEDVKGKMLFHRFNKMPIAKDLIDYDRYVKQSSIKNSKPVFLKNHQIIDLGNKHVEVFHTPGHSYGHVMFLEHETGRLFSGDQLSKHNIWHFSSSDEQAPFIMSLQSLKELKTYQGKIKGIYPAHNVYNCGIELLDDLIECLETEIKENYLHDEPFHHAMGDGYKHFYKSVFLIYSDERLSEFIGKKIQR